MNLNDSTNLGSYFFPRQSLQNPPHLGTHCQAPVRRFWRRFSRWRRCLSHFLGRLCGPQGDIKLQAPPFSPVLRLGVVSVHMKKPTLFVTVFNHRGSTWNRKNMCRPGWSNNQGNTQTKPDGLGGACFVNLTTRSQFTSRQAVCPACSWNPSLKSIKLSELGLVSIHRKVCGLAHPAA